MTVHHLSFPAHDHLSTKTGTGDSECHLVLGVVETISNHSGDVESAFKQHRHLIPSVEHFTPIDALDGQHLEHDCSNIHTDLSRRQTEHSNSASMGHLGDHVAECRRAAGHLEADIETLAHIEFALRVSHIVAVDIHRSGDTQLACQR